MTEIAQDAERIAKRAVSGAWPEGQIAYEIEKLLREVQAERDSIEQQAQAAYRIFKAENAQLRQQRDEYKTLSGIGVWHKDCRPNREMAARELQKSQAVIDKLADTITQLRQQRDGLKPLLLQVEWALRMFTESKTPWALDVPQLLRNIDKGLRAAGVETPPHHRIRSERT